MRIFVGATVGVVAMTVSAFQSANAQERPAAPFDVAHCCYATDDSGELTGFQFLVPLQAPAAMLRGGAPMNAAFETIIDHGPSSNRVDIVLVGDGFTEEQLPLYAERADALMQQAFTDPLYGAYKRYFNVHRVDVISNESGVDHDPTPPIFRDTALNMEFWCGGTERALCVDVALAWSYAAAAPDAQQVLAIANSSKYGGVGYIQSDVATTSSNNSSSVETVLHELGHTFSDLADEYFYDGLTYTGSEPTLANASKLNAMQMASANTKWAAWLGVNMGSQWDGAVGTFEGCSTYDFGIYRPSQNSKMRALGRPFNLPSAEAFILEIYKSVDPIDAATPPGENLPVSTTFFVEPMKPTTHPLQVQWRLNGQPIPGATETTFNFLDHDFDIESTTYELSVVVKDMTSLVRNEVARAQHMTSTRHWTIVALVGDINGDALVNGTDIAILLSGWGPDGGFGADLNSDGFVNGVDLAILLTNWTN